MHVVVGTDTYGRVKAVGKTAVVTSFAMIQLLPLGPLQSYYVWGTTRSQIAGIPLLAYVQKVTFQGVPLARVDRTSVVFAYLRAVLAVLVLFGFIGTFCGLMFSGQRLDDFAQTAIRFAQGCLIAGVAGGVATYVVPTAGRRERAIRKYCGELLGVCIDPGRVAPEYAAAIRETLPRADNPDPAGVLRQRSDFIRELVLARCADATDHGHDREARTDELLEQLRHLGQAGADNQARVPGS